jgi:acetyltransferase AlgX (SGNH hydrolase-like protein)
VHPGDAARWGLIGARGEEFRARAHAAAVALEAAGIPFVDATPALERAAGSGRMFYWLDTHLTPAGNRVVADEILSRLGG